MTLTSSLLPYELVSDIDNEVNLGAGSKSVADTMQSSYIENFGDSFMKITQFWWEAFIGKREQGKRIVNRFCVDLEEVDNVIVPILVVRYRKTFLEFW